MFGFGFSETITIVIVILVLINPKELPTIMKKGGKFYGKIIREFNGVKRTFKDLEKEVNTLSEIKDDIGGKK